MREAGLSDRIEIRVQDYRELDDGPFDKIASVGMYEHVGRGELDHYARTVHALLKPGGLFLNHGIARLHSEAPDKDTFIYRYVFPDGELSPVTDVLTSLQSAGLEVRDVESLREHYPLTLRRWLANLDAHREEAVADVGDERERVWRLYMLASALGFEAGDVTVYQTLTDPRRRAARAAAAARRCGCPHRRGRRPYPRTHGNSLYGGRREWESSPCRRNSPPDGDDKMTVQAANTHRTSSSLPHAYLLPVVRELPSLPSAALTTQTW